MDNIICVQQLLWHPSDGVWRQRLADHWTKFMSMCHYTRRKCVCPWTGTNQGFWSSVNIFRTKISLQIFRQVTNWPSSATRELDINTWPACLHPARASHLGAGAFTGQNFTSNGRVLPAIETDLTHILRILISPSKTYITAWIGKESADFQSPRLLSSASGFSSLR